MVAKERQVLYWRQRSSTSSSTCQGEVGWSYCLIPLISAWLNKNHREVNYLTELISGHGCLRSYLHRFKRDESTKSFNYSSVSSPHEVMPNGGIRGDTEAWGRDGFCRYWHLSPTCPEQTVVPNDTLKYFLNVCKNSKISCLFIGVTTEILKTPIKLCR